MYPLASVEARGDGHHVIVVSQDCDVVQGNCAIEPGVEVVVAVPLPGGLDRRHQNLRDPRLLHLELRGPERTRYPVAVSPWARGVIARERLLEHSPDESVGLRDTDLQDLAAFLARRYDRDAFPEEFANRFQVGFDKLRGLFRAHEAHILQIYLRVEPFDELDPYDPTKNDDDEQPRYDVDIVVLVTDDLMDNRAAYAALKDSGLNSAVRSIRRQCPGVEVEDHVLLDWDRLTVKRASKLRRVDLAADQSIASGRQAAAVEPNQQ